MSAQMKHLRYPTGRWSGNAGAVSREQSIAAIRDLPRLLRNSVDELSETQLNTPYREGGWTVRQVVHHVADSHMNAVMRLKLALTEEWPVIKPYREGPWAELRDARTLAPEISLRLLEPLHERWIALLEGLQPENWEQRGYVHPENGRMSLAQMTGCMAGMGLTIRRR